MRAGAGSRLSSLDLSNSALAQASAEVLGRALAAQGPAGRLRSLTLSENAIGPAGAAHIANGLCAGSCCLEDFDLGSNALGGEGAALIVGALASASSAAATAQPPASRLRTLRLSGNAIGDAGVAAVLGAGLDVLLENSPSLTELEMGSNCIGDAGCLALARWAATRFSTAPAGGGTAASWGADAPPSSSEVPRRHAQSQSAAASASRAKQPLNVGLISPRKLQFPVDREEEEGGGAEADSQRNSVSAGTARVIHGLVREINAACAATRGRALGVRRRRERGPPLTVGWLGEDDGLL